MSNETTELNIALPSALEVKSGDTIAGAYRVPGTEVAIVRECLGGGAWYAYRNGKRDQVVTALIGKELDPGVLNSGMFVQIARVIQRHEQEKP